MHIMHVLGSFGPGGAEMGVVRLVNAMSDKSIRHSVCSINSDLRMKQYLPKSIRCYSLGVDGSSLFAFKPLSAIFRSADVDIVHVNNIAPWFDVAVASKLSGCRCIQTFHGVEDISIQFSMLKKLQLYCSLKLSNHVNAVSDASADLFTKLTGINKSCISVINNGVDANFFSPIDPVEKKMLRQRLNLPKEAIILGCVAALRTVKNHRDLLFAFKTVAQTHKEAVLVLVGDGVLHDELKLQCKKLGISDHVIFTGRRENVDQYLKAFDVFVLNSKTEGLSYAVLEAMACALPVVATDVGGNSQLIENGIDGFLYPDGDGENLSRIMVQMIETQDEIRSMGERARKKIINTYSLEAMIEKYLALYKGFK